MKISTDRLHYWFQAIRKSPDPQRTLDAFWQGQIRSKEWLIDNISPYIVNNCCITIYGGWVGVLASMMFESFKNIKHIINVDIDPLVEPIAKIMNQEEYNQGKFNAVTKNMVDYTDLSDIVINTSCEHINQKDYELWLSNISKNSIIVLQSNNYIIDEHIRIAKNLDEFVKQSNLNIINLDVLELPLYNRFMLIGKKVV